MQRFSTTLPGLTIVFAACLAAPCASAQDPATEPRADREEERIRRLGDALSVAPEEEWVPRLEIDLTRQRVGELFTEAEDRTAAGRLTLPRGGSAADSYREILALDPDQTEAARLLAEALDGLRGDVDAAIANDDFDRATELVTRLGELAPNDPDLERLQAETSRNARIDGLRGAARDAAAAGRLAGEDGAVASWQGLLALAPEDEEALDELARLPRIRRTFFGGSRKPSATRPGPWPSRGA